MIFERIVFFWSLIKRINRLRYVSQNCNQFTSTFISYNILTVHVLHYKYALVSSHLTSQMVVWMNPQEAIISMVIEYSYVKVKTILISRDVSALRKKQVGMLYTNMFFDPEFKTLSVTTDAQLYYFLLKSDKSCRFIWR